MTRRVRSTLAVDPTPPWLGRTLLALGVLSALALPALTGAFALRLDDAFGVTYAPLEVRDRDTANGTFTAFRVNALKANPAQDHWFEEGRAVLTAQNGRVDAVSVTARSCADGGASCARTVTMLFPVSTRDLTGEWRIQGEFTWLSRDLRVTSGHDVAFSGTGARFDA